MAVPVSQMWTVASYVLRQKLAGRKRYPLVLMLEPLFRCNLACAGCGKIQYPAHILKTDLSPEDCFKAVDECGAPMVSIPGGEPLMHPQIDKIVEGLVARKKYIYLCTNALLLKEKLHLFKPSKYLSFSVHVDGQKEHHDFSVCREGGYELALDGIRAAIEIRGVDHLSGTLRGGKAGLGHRSARGDLALRRRHTRAVDAVRAAHGEVTSVIADLAQAAQCAAVVESTACAGGMGFSIISTFQSRLTSVVA